MSRRIVVWLALGIGSGIVPAAAQPAFKPKPSSIPQAEIEAALRKGAAFLKGAAVPQIHSQSGNSLVLYALLHSGLPREDETFQTLLQQVVKAPPAKTYHVALAAMALSEMDKVGYRWKLEEYAQFLVNTQCQNGQWSYGEKVKIDSPGPPKADPASVASGPGGQAVRSARLFGTRYPEGYVAGAGGNTAARTVVRQTDRGKPEGDNSNSQYAALGLRACAEAGVYPDPRCIESAMRWWAQCQNDGGWGYKGDEKGTRGSLTAGGVGAVAIYNWMINRDWKSDLMVKKGVMWLNEKWSVSKNPGADRNFYYYLYALERAGMIVGTDTLGDHDWYDEGARAIMKQQAKNGSWCEPDGRNYDKDEQRLVDTCFALLFLSKATRPLVYSGH